MHLTSAERKIDAKVSQISQNPIVEEAKPELIRIAASRLSESDKFLKYRPRSREEETLKTKLLAIIGKGIKDFYKFNCDPCFNNDWSGFTYGFGKFPAVGKTKDWWDLAAKRVGGRVGKRREYIAFLGIVIQKLIESGWTEREAWNAVCNNSAGIGNYFNSSDSARFENTGTRKVVGFYDLANTYKLVAADKHEDNEMGILAGGYYLRHSQACPLSSMQFQKSPFTDVTDAVGWIVFDRKITLADLGGVA